MCSEEEQITFQFLGPQILTKFNPECMIFLVWQNSFEYLVELLKISDDSKNLFLLDMLESSVIRTIKNKIGNINISNLSYDTLMSTLEKLFSNFEDQFAARFRFDWRDQMEGESIEHYANVLTNLIAKCNYGSKASVNLINRFTIGLRNKQAQSQLLQMENIITFDEAVNLAERIEFLQRSKRRRRKGGRRRRRSKRE